jgi:predicted ABC-type ATPase
MKPALVVIAGPMGAGKTTFYEAHLKEAFPIVVPPIRHQRDAMLRERRSFAVEDLTVDTDFLESARQAGYATKVFFISTEDPNLNVGRIVVRMSRGGQSVPLEAVPDSYEEAMKNLPNARRHADDLLVYDNTPNGRGHRLVARFIAGELVKVTNTSPEWIKKVFGRELRGEARQQEKSSRGR